MGSIPIILLPYSLKFRRIILGFAAQAMIYSNNYRLYALQNKEDIYKIGDWDEYMNFNLDIYSYYKPLITQICNETENRQNCSSHMGLNNIGIWIINKLGMDKNPQPGFNIAYIAGNIFSISLIILIVWLLFKFAKYILNII